MADDTQTREEEVEATYTAWQTNNPEAWPQIITALLHDISVSLAMLVDAGSSSSD